MFFSNFICITILIFSIGIRAETVKKFTEHRMTREMLIFLTNIPLNK